VRAASRGDFGALREAWSLRTGPVDPTPAVEVRVPEAPGVWPSEFSWEPSPSHELPGPPGGYSAGLVNFRRADGSLVATAAAVGDERGLRVALPEVPHPLLGRWDLPAVSLALPGAVEYHLGAQGLSAWFPASPRRAALVVQAGCRSGLDVRVQARVPWIQVDPPGKLSVPAGGEELVGFRVVGAPLGGSGEVQILRKQDLVARVRVAVRPDPQVVRCDLRVQPQDLGTVSAQSVELRLQLERVSGAGRVEGWVLVSTVPAVTTIPVFMEEGANLWEGRLDLEPGRLPRGEKGTLTVRLVARGQAGEVHALPFRRLWLRRNLARVDLRFGRYEPRPFRRLGFRFSDGRAASVHVQVPGELHDWIEVRRLGDARFLVIGRQAPPGPLEGTLLARDSASGLEEGVPVRLVEGGRMES